jgi:hypothetical protein
MIARLKRLDVFLALVTIGGVSFWGDSSTRFADVAWLLVFWAVYFTAAIGMWLFTSNRMQPAPVKS